MSIKMETISSVEQIDELYKKLAIQEVRIYFVFCLYVNDSLAEIYDIVC